jgi:HEPN domain-containing protein
MKGPREHALGLLAKADHDLVAAKATLPTGDAYDTICFHAQQAVEKCLKALLALMDIEYPRRHDLGELLALAKPHYPNLCPLEDAILELAPYAVEVRYDDEVAPGDEDARAALDTAIAVRALAEMILASGGQQPAAPAPEE